jgi:tetratricopeptide (TPR) repeat protein
VHRQAADLAKQGRELEAAELCFTSGLLDDAAGYFIKVGEFIRAAEVRHAQDRMVECAELYIQGEEFALAGRIFVDNEDPARAADAYEQGGNASVAAELYESVGNHIKAGKCYEESGFLENAAQEYTKCGKWEEAATCFEQTILEETGGAGAEVAQSARVQKLVRMAGNLYQRAGFEDKAETVFARGGCFESAAQIAADAGRDEVAIEYFLQAKDAPRAAEIMERIGKAGDAARVLAEHHRDLGDDEECARCYERAEDWLAAGDIYRMLEQYPRAAACYQNFGDSAQAAEMFGMADDSASAAQCYEEAGLFAEAAECLSSDGDELKQADLLARAGNQIQAAEMHLASDRVDEAIHALQQVTSESADFTTAAAMLGDIFRERGKHSLAIAKLRQATEGAELGTENIRAFFGLAAALDANGDLEEAKALYERIQSVQYEFEDVAERLVRTRKKLEEKAKAEPAMTSATVAVNQPAKPARYKITGKLGRGGMGIVYKATDTVLDRTVAFKVLPDSFRENPEALKNFLREAKSAAMLNHPGIVTVFDAGEQEGVFFIAMEYVDGNTIKDIIKKRGKVSPGGIIHVATQMCEALGYAHEHKIVHRDIKSANAMWTRDRKVKIMDFGLAKVIEEVRNHTTVVSGTPYYMSPEQTLGKNVDHRTDLYSLGVTIFELATGTLPFKEGNLPYHHVHTAPPDPREFNAELPGPIAKIILRCLEKDPAARYQSALEIAEDFKAVAQTMKSQQTQT